MIFSLATTTIQSALGCALRNSLRGGMKCGTLHRYETPKGRTSVDYFGHSLLSVGAEQ